MALSSWAQLDASSILANCGDFVFAADCKVYVIRLDTTAVFFIMFSGRPPEATVGAPFRH